MGSAVWLKASWSCVSVIVGLACRNSAAMLAMCGVAAEVPKKFGNVALFMQPATVELSGMFWLARVNPRNVSLPPSGPTKSGFCLITCAGRRSPLASNKIGSPPTDEKYSSVGAAAPQAGVCRKNAAPIAMAPAAPG